jgi:spore photoproduct lyase
VARDSAGLPVVISGGRRLAALRSLGIEKVPCLALENVSQAPDPAFLIMAAITDNLGRGFNQAELTLAWDTARREAPEGALPKIAALLGLKPNGQRLAALEKAALLPRAALDALAQGALDPENAHVLAEWGEPQREMALELFARVGPSRQNRRQWLEWLNDLRDSRGDDGLARILSSPALKSLSGPMAEREARDHIRSLRFPYLTALAQTRKRSLKALALPGNLRLELDPDFEDVSATLKMTFSEPHELRELAAFALKLAADGALEALWALNPPRRGGPGGPPVIKGPTLVTPGRARFLVEAEFMGLDLDGEKIPTPPVAAADYRDLKPGGILVTRHRGSFLRPCPATPRYNCCGLNIFHVGQGCDINCSYCILSAYLKTQAIIFFGNSLSDGLGELAKRLDAETSPLPDPPTGGPAPATPRSHRYCTGEFTDSLLWDRPAKVSQKLIELFAPRAPFTLELKTKTDKVKHLLGLHHGGRTVISFSVNAPEVCAREEPGAASLTDRLNAAALAWSKGYPIGLHFDPLIHYPGWETGYARTAKLIAERLDPRSLAFVSLGCFRYLPELKAVMRKARPSRLFGAEFVRGGDGKMRYPRPIRRLMYRTLLNYLEPLVSPGTKIYLCMESGRVWQETFGYDPGTIGLTNMFRNQTPPDA